MKRRPGGSATLAGPGPWSGFDQAFHSAIRAPHLVDEGESLSLQLADDIAIARGRPYRLGPPAVVRTSLAHRIRRFARTLHRAVETIVRRYPTDSSLQRIITTPAQLRADIERDRLPQNRRIHLCRLDLVLDDRVGFRVLEVNANCPAALVYAGYAARQWRALLVARGISPPAPLCHEHERWMARWFVQAAARDSGRSPDTVALLRQEGGIRTELGQLADQLAMAGIEAVEADPREVSLSASGDVSIRGRGLHHAYLKLGMPEFLSMRAQLEPFVRAVRSGALFLQNGQRARWIGDNKLCLAALSDLTNTDLLSAEDREVLNPHIPWSRNAALCSDEELAEVRGAPEAFVLKRPLDTRGRGVVIGLEAASQGLWLDAVEHAVQEGWLVQRFHLATRIESGLAGDETVLHDLAVGLIDGEVEGAFMRSSDEWRSNIAFGGRLHPVFFEG